VDVVGTDAGSQESLHQAFHDRGVVVHTLQEDGLAAQRDAGVRESAEGVDGGGRQLVRMVEMRVDVQGMVAAQDAAQLGGDALREATGAADSAPDELET